MARNKCDMPYHSDRSHTDMRWVDSRHVPVRAGANHHHSQLRAVDEEPPDLGAARAQRAAHSVSLG